MAVFVFPEKADLAPVQKDFAETARYLGYRKVSPPEKDVSILIEECVKEMYNVLMPKAVYEKFDLTLGEGGEIAFGDLHFISKDLSRNLKNCRYVYIFAATIGPQVDMIIRRYEKVDVVKAAIMQSAGAMFVEKVVDAVNDKIKKDGSLSGGVCHPRFSPGYGDVKLEMQKDFFRLLPCSKIGLTLMETLIMAPEKSVTAFVGYEVPKA